MANLFLLRHLKSQWNEDNRFAGWVDNPLSRNGRAMAKEISDLLVNMYKTDIDVVYTTPLIRNLETVLRVFEYWENKYPLFLHLDGGKMQQWGHFADISEYDVPCYVSESLNERYYGQLQGLEKEQVKERYGEKTVYLWRRGYKERPPGGESLEDVYKRTVPFFKKYVEKEIAKNKNILLVISHNSLRTLIKYIENLTDDQIKKTELPFGSLIHYEFDQNGLLLSQKYFNE